MNDSERQSSLLFALKEINLLKERLSRHLLTNHGDALDQSKPAFIMDEHGDSNAAIIREAYDFTLLIFVCVVCIASNILVGIGIVAFINSGHYLLALLGLFILFFVSMGSYLAIHTCYHAGEYKE